MKKIAFPATIILEYMDDGYDTVLTLIDIKKRINTEGGTLEMITGYSGKETPVLIIKP